MSKCILFFILLLSLNVSAQENAVIKASPTRQNTWDEQEPFVNGFARVLKNNKFSFINKSGKLIAPLQFDGARNYSNHLAAVEKDNQWGFINESGELIVPLKYDIVYDFTETITGVFGNKRWWIINTKAEVTKALDVSVFYGFKNGVAKLVKNDRWGTMNVNGEIIFDKVQPAATTNNIVPFKPKTSSVTSGITVCPDNIDFEYGSFFNWKCFTGHVDSIGNTNVITLNPSPPTPNRHTLYNRVMPSAIDPYGLFPTNPPDGSNFALRLGNTLIGGEAEGTTYTIKVPANDSNFSIKYDYAVVFQNPGHTLWSQPRFQVKVFDSAANKYVDCASFEYISTSNLPGFAQSTVDTSVIYKPWSTVYLSLRGYAGKTMYLEFKNADCVRKGHWGYSYIDVEKPCGQSIEMNYDCTAPNITTLKGPPGFQIYNWWDQTFGTLLGTGQQIVLNPGPAINTTIWLEMIPFNDFGCLDTIPVKIDGVFTADFGMSDTNGICAPHSFTFYNRNLPSTSVTWDFGDGTTGTGDSVTHIYNNVGSYLVKMDVIMAGGCIGTETKLVSVVNPVGSFTYSGGNYCDSQTVRFDAITSFVDSLHWDFGDGTTLVTTQTSVIHTYNKPGVFIPSMIMKSAGGCETPVPGLDTIKIEMLKVGYANTDIKICGSTTVNFTDTSSSYFGISSILWNFGDGNSGSGANVSHTYTATGIYNVRETITGVSGCSLSTVKPIYVKVNDAPVIAIAGPASACQTSNITFTSTLQSIDSVNYYYWISSNGYSGTGTSFAVPFSLPGNYTIKLVVRTVNGCYDSTSQPIQIYPTPDVVQLPNQTLCNGSFTTAMNFTGAVPSTIYNWTNTFAGIGIPASGTGDIASFQANSNGNYTANATITVTPTANGCPGSPKMIVLTVNPTPNVIQPADQTLCGNSNTTAIAFTGAVAGATYNWTNNNTDIGLASSGTGDIPSFAATTNGGNITTATITVTPTFNGCPGTPKTFTITVNPTPDIARPGDQTLCNNNNTTAIIFSGSVSGTTYNWVNSNTSIGLAASGSGDIASFVATNSGTTSSTSTITVTPSINGCTVPAKTFTITVHPTANVVQPADQTLCNNSNTTAINFNGAVPGTIYNWVNNNTTIGLSASGTGDIPSFTATSNGSTTAIATIRVTPIFNGCPGSPKIFSITVNPVPDVAQPGNQTLCNNNNTAAINFTGSVAGTTYNWINTNTSIGLAASGAGDISSFVATNNGTTTAVATITVTPTFSGCTVPSKTFTITVHPTADVVQPANQNLCGNSNTAAITFSGAVPGTVYSWINNNTSIGLAASGIGNIPSFVAISNGFSAETATITVTPIFNGCPGAPKIFTITVNTTPDVAQLPNQTLCNGNFATAMNFTSAVPGAIYNWTNTFAGIGIPASGTGDIASFQAFSNGNYAANATITVTPTFNGCPGAPKVITLTVNPTPSVVQPADQTLCRNSNTTAVAFTGMVAGTTYNWTNNNTAIGLAASGTGDIPSFITTTNGFNVTVAAITVTPSFNGCPGTPKTFTITVNPTPDIAQPNDQTLCNNNNTSAINFNGSVTGATYNWSNNNTSIGLAANGTGDIPSFIATNSGATIATSTITVSSIFNGCTVPSKTFIIAVNPTPNVAQPVNQALCSNGNTAAITFNGAVAGTVYNWTNNNTAIGLPASGVGNIASFVAINNGSAVSTATVTVTPTFNGCAGTPKTFAITINPIPNMDPVANQQLCNGNLTSPINFTGTVANTVYNWTNTAPSIGLAASGTGDIPSFKAISNGAFVSNATITVSAAANGCGIPNKTFTITVNPMPDVIQPLDQSVCNGEIINATGFTGSVTGAVYQWTNSNTAIGLPASGNGNIASLVAVNNTAIPITATITINPATATCTGTPKSFKITINPTPAVVAKNSRNVCLGTSVQLNATGATQYSWTPTDHLTCSNCDAPLSKPIDSIQYKVKGTNSFGCIAYDSVLLSVIKPFKMKVSPNDTLCIGETTNLKASQANTYLWSPSAGLNTTTSASTTAAPSITTKYQVVGFDAYNCFTDTGYVLITVGPKPKVNLGPDRTMTTGSTLALNPTIQNGPIIKWAWTPATELSCSNCASPTAIVKNNSFYSVEVTNTFGCVASDTLFINSLCKSAQVYIPNAFTPDGDGLNDIFMVRGRGITVKSFRIFNRWGELVFERKDFYPDDPKNGWDGKVRGVPATPDVFVYTAEVFCDNGVPYTYKGNVTILK